MNTQNNWTLEEFDRLSKDKELKCIVLSAVKKYGRHFRFSGDEIQQCFYINLFDSLRKYNGKIKFTTFLFNNARFYLLNYRKEVAPLRPTHLDILYDEDYEGIDRQIDTNTLLKELSEEEQSILRLYYFDDYSMRGAAELLGMHRLMFRRKLKMVLEKVADSGVFSNR